MKFKFHFTAFIIAFILSIGYIIITNNTKEKIVKTPTPFSDYLYSDFDGECYRVKVAETECVGDETEFNI